MDWNVSAVTMPPPGLRVLVTDGHVVLETVRRGIGRWERIGKLDPMFWTPIGLLPERPYMQADGSTIIPLRGLSNDIGAVAMPGDELWGPETMTTMLSDGTKPFLYFVDTSYQATTIRVGKSRAELYADWNFIKLTIWRLGWDASYLRRPMIE